MPSKSGASSIGDFKKGPKAIELPSGNRMVLKKAGLQALIASGSIPNELLGPVQSEIDKVKGKKKIEKPDPLDIASKLNPEQMNQMLKMMETVVCVCAIEPQVHPIPRDDDGDPLPLNDRDETKLYVDELEEEDRVFIFQYVTGGTKDLATFREQVAGFMAVVSGQ